MSAQISDRIMTFKNSITNVIHILHFLLNTMRGVGIFLLTITKMNNFSIKVLKILNNLKNRVLPKTFSDF